MFLRYVSYSCSGRDCLTSDRFICPAIVSPETIDIEINREEGGGTISRGLLVIAKVFQNLANNIQFGKERHMLPLNDFLHAHVGSSTLYLGLICVCDLFDFLICSDIEDQTET